MEAHLELITAALKAVLEELPALELEGRHRRRTAFVRRFLLSTGLRIS